MSAGETTTQPEGYVEIPLDRPVWERFPIVAPLVLVATTEPDGTPDVAPKHLAMPVSWENWFGFVCHPDHGTYRNALRTGVFTVGYPSPTMLLEASLAAAPRETDGSKPTLDMLRFVPATAVAGHLIEGCRLHLECELHDTVEGLGHNVLLLGKVVAVHASAKLVRRINKDEHDALAASPLLAYIHPGRVATIDETQAFPYHLMFKR